MIMMMNFLLPFIGVLFTTWGYHPEGKHEIVICLMSWCAGPSVWSSLRDHATDTVLEMDLNYVVLDCPAQM